MLEANRREAFGEEEKQATRVGERRARLRIRNWRWRQGRSYVLLLGSAEPVNLYKLSRNYCFALFSKGKDPACITPDPGAILAWLRPYVAAAASSGMGRDFGSWRIRVCIYFIEVSGF